MQRLILPANDLSWLVASLMTSDQKRIQSNRIWFVVYFRRIKWTWCPCVQRTDGQVREWLNEQESKRRTKKNSGAFMFVAE